MRVEYSEPLAAWMFSLRLTGKVRTGHIRYMGWMDALVTVFFPKLEIVTVGKSKVMTKENNEQHKQGAQRRAQRGVHTAQHTLQQPGNQQPAYFSGIPSDAAYSQRCG